MLETGVSLRNRARVAADEDEIAARDLTLEAARDASVARKTRRQIPPAQLRTLLESRKEGEVIDGLRRVLAVCYSTSISHSLHGC